MKRAIDLFMHVFKKNAKFRWGVIIALLILTWLIIRDINYEKWYGDTNEIEMTEPVTINVEDTTEVLTLPTDSTTTE